MYAATAYALCIGTTEAFAPQFGVGLRSTQHKTALCMSGTSKIKNENPDDFVTYLSKRKAAEDGVQWTPAGTAPRALQAPPKDEAQAARASGPPSEPAGKTVTGYTPPYGYESQTIKRVTATATATAGYTVNAAPIEAKGWRPPTGYGSETIQRSQVRPLPPPPCTLRLQTILLLLLPLLLRLRQPAKGGGPQQGMALRP